MEEIIAGNVEQLCENFKGKDVYIYGAKSVALRTCKCAENPVRVLRKDIEWFRWWDTYNSYD